MRRAFQRCSASIPQATLPLSNSRYAVARLLTGNKGVSRASFQHINGNRLLHTSTTLSQQSATQSQSSSSATTETASAPITRFEELDTRKIIHPNVVKTITRDMGLETMTEVQSATISAALSGVDIVAQAKTGTGKTMAFLLPVLQNIIKVDPRLAIRGGDSRGPRTTADDIRALIISPTRELAEQIAAEAKRLTRNTGVIVQTAVGGTQKSAGLRAIQRDGCHILVGTPGRLNDILSDPYSRVEAPDLSALVLDEADRLLDQGFWPAIQEIQQHLPNEREQPRQNLMFSATIPREVVDIVRTTLKPGFKFVKCIKDDEEPTHARVPQRLVQTRGLENSFPALVELCSREIEKASQADGRPFKAIIYYNSTAEVTAMSSALKSLSPPEAQNGGPATDAFGYRARRAHPWADTRVYEIHSKLTQAQRTAAADIFRNCKSGILVSSDVTARGMDFPNVTHVIQVGVAPTREQYIHRIGRTARAGKEGEAWPITNQIETSEVGHRLRGLPLKKDNSLESASLDMGKASDVSPATGRVLTMCQEAMQRVGRREKVKFYMAMLGVYQWVSNKGSLISALNNLSRFGWGLPDPPAVPLALARKLRIDRIPGVNIGEDPDNHDPVDGRGSGGGRGRDFGDNRGRSAFGGDRGSGFGGDRRNSFGGDRSDRGRGFDGDRSDRGRGFGDRGSRNSGGYSRGPRRGAQDFL